MTYRAARIKEETKQAGGWKMREGISPVWLWLLKLPKLTAASVSLSIKWERSFARC